MVTGKVLMVGVTIAVTIFAGVVAFMSPKVEEKVEAGSAVVACLILAYVLVVHG